MRRTMLLLIMLAFSVLAFAQRTVTGTVQDERGQPIPFATVTVEGTQNAVQADANGVFTIRTADGARLLITATGFQASTVIASGDNLSATLNRREGQLSEVVVTTAFGLRRSERLTPFSAQVVNAEQLNVVRQPNLNNALAGKVAGVQFRGQSAAALDREAFIRIRGGQSLNDRGPIYVVDGTILETGIDINPDDVESLNVLKGANATALFGARAANGAIVITTKKRGNRKGAGIEVNQALTFDRVYVLPKYQNQYAGGDGDFITFDWKPGMPEEWRALNGKPHHDFTDDASWGPRMEGQEYIPWYAFIPGHSRSFQTARLTPQPNNVRDFWRTGVTNNTNVNFTQGGQNYNVRVSLTNQFINGILPYTNSNRNNIFTGLSYDLGAKLNVGLNLTYSTQRIKGQFEDAYANASTGNFTQWFHRDLDMGILKELQDQRTPINTLASWNFRRNPNAWVTRPGRESVYAGNYWYNPYSYFKNIDYTQWRNRLYGDVSLTYKVVPGFSLRGTVRKNQFIRSYENIDPTILERSGVQSGFLAGYATGQRNDDEYNYEFIASFTKTFGDFAVNASAGANKLTFRRRDVTANTNQGLTVPDLYAISNSLSSPSIENFKRNYDVNSLFATGDFEFRRFVSLTWAVRNDWYSTLPVNDNALLSPSVGASFIFSEFTQNALPWLSFGKVFGSWGRKPLALDPYELNLNYRVNQFQWGGNILMSTPNVLPDQNLRGALVSTFEAGIDMRFLNNRLGLNVTYYNENNDQEPLSVAVSGASGFTSKRVNIAQIVRQGLEAEITARPIARRDFTWSITKNFHYLIDNTVKNLAPGVPSYTLSGGAFGTRFARAFHIEGKQWGMLRGGGIKRNEEGKPLITENLFSGGLGWFVGDENKEWGSIVPKVTGGFQNLLNYKNWNLGITIDYQVGGKFFSLSEQWGNFSGLLENTAAMNDRGKNVRDPVAEGGGVRVQGVDAADGKTPVDIYISAYDYYHQFYFQRVAEPFIHDLTYVKLREVSLGYTIPVEKMGRFGRAFQGANVSLIARNPLLIYRKTVNFDPSEVSYNFGEEGQLPGTRSLGINLKLNF